MYQCSHCELELEDNEISSNAEGFWCDSCDGFTYYGSIKNRHRFTLILEKEINKNKIKTKKNKKFKKQLSPFRYPGGKSKVIDYLYLHLNKNEKSLLVSPFSGGASFELAMLEAGVVSHLHLNDLDFGIYSVWYMIKHWPEELIDRIQSVSLTHEDYYISREKVNNGYKHMDIPDAAWCSLLVNRLAFSGIPKANPLGGKNGTISQLTSRYNPLVLAKRIKKVHSMSERITITQNDAIQLIEEEYWNSDATIFIDPPYVNKGKDLYNCYYNKRDHIELAALLDSLHFGCPGADIVVTYDYNEWLNNLYNYPKVEMLGRSYSI